MAATKDQPTTMNGSLIKHVRPLKDFSAGLLTLATLAPDRLTAAQLTFFMLAGIADIYGHPTTFTEIRETTGERIGKSLHTTYKVFLDDKNRDPRRQLALGWLLRETDPSDNRRKYLRLTKEGRKVMSEVINAISDEGHA